MCFRSLTQAGRLLLRLVPSTHQPAWCHNRPVGLSCYAKLFCLPCLFAEETPVHSKLLLHYARRLCTKTGTLPPPELQQLVTTEALVLVSPGFRLLAVAARARLGMACAPQQLATPEAFDADVLVFLPASAPSHPHVWTFRPLVVT